jgi:hydroxymethylpyrimidine pyrophosphatase-like HAD family hydrolase
MLDEVVNIPSAFRKLDLTTFDVLALGREYITLFPDRRQPVLAVGLRTAGTYFAQLFRALLERAGYGIVETVTIRPDTGVAPRERVWLQQSARAGFQAVLLDDPPVTGETFADAADLLHRLGFATDRVVCLFPEGPSRRAGDLPALAHLRSVSLKPDQWHKGQLLDAANVEGRLTEYARGRGHASARVVTDSPAAQAFERRLAGISEDERRTRLKRVFEVRLETDRGTEETRFILAKSVGWGYLAYHAFLAARRLADMVPPLWGLRDGLLYVEWLPQDNEPPGEASRDQWIDSMADYVAARARRLPLPASASVRGQHKYNHGFELLDKMLSRAYGHRLLARLMRRRVRRRLAHVPCPLPTLIDGKMRPAEWITSEPKLLKTDFEHHGMGKNELNVADPAYDLAEAILQLSLSPSEEAWLLDRYRAASGDATVDQRLFLYKLLAGAWTMAGAVRNLEQPRLASRQQEFHRDYCRAWDFITEQTARHCGRLCVSDRALSWRGPLVILDIDGVIDRRIFGFPCTTAAGIQALALLHAHGLPIALNTARSVSQVRAYCQAYGCAGAVAEYGSYLWDAVNKRGRVLLSEEVLGQLDLAREALARLPGVFLHDGYQYAIRACTYDNGGPVPLPLPLVQRVLSARGLEQLTLHQTSIDSTITARQSNKGTGLKALLDWVGLTDAETIAVGDSEPDLPMFRAAKRSFAPAHIGCGRMARILGCQIAPHPFQRGLLHIARSLVHPDGTRCPRCAAGVLPRPGDDLFLDLLRAADEKPSRLLLRALCHPDTLRLFVR